MQKCVLNHSAKVNQRKYILDIIFVYDSAYFYSHNKGNISQVRGSITLVQIPQTTLDSLTERISIALCSRKLNQRNINSIFLSVLITHDE